MEKMQKLVAFAGIIFLGISMLISIKRDRPIEVEQNYENESMILHEYTGEFEIKQTLDIFHEDREIKNIFIYYENALEKGDIVNITLIGNGKAQNVTVDSSLGKDGEYALPFSFDEDGFSDALLIIEGDIQGKIGFYYAQKDLINMGKCVVNEEKVDGSLAIKAELIIKNLVWDELYIPLILIYILVGVITLVYQNGSKESVLSGRITFGCAVFLNFVCLVVLNPYFLCTSYIAENSLNFYYLTQKYNTIDVLFMSDAGYLPILQRLIALIFVKGFQLGTDSLYFMQFVGLTIDILIVSAINLYSYRLNIKRELRFFVSLVIMFLFVHPTVSTFFNFIYLGYYLITLLMISDLEELKSWQYWSLTIFSALICLSKGFYVVMFPVGVIELVLFGNVAGRRKNIFSGVIALAALIQFIFDFSIGKAGDKWFGQIANSNYVSAKIVIFLLIAGFIILYTFFYALRKWYGLPKENRKKYMNIILLFILLCGSFVIGTVGFKCVNMNCFWNWATAWYIPASIALIFLLIELMGGKYSKHFRIKEVAILLFCFVLIMSIRGTRNKLDYSYKMVDWNIYKDYFDDTIVPVFAYDTRFGTLADGYTLWYTNKKPADNYSYGAPYQFNKLEMKNEEGQYINTLDLEETFLDKAISAIYMNNINNVGNSEVILALYNEYGKEIAEVESKTPLSAKTMGFIMDNPINNVKYIKVQSKNGEDVYVTGDIYIVSAD